MDVSRPYTRLRGKHSQAASDPLRNLVNLWIKKPEKSEAFHLKQAGDTLTAVDAHDGFTQ